MTMTKSTITHSTKPKRSTSTVKRRLITVAAATVLVITGPACGSALAVGEHYRSPNYNWLCYVLPWKC